MYYHTRWTLVYPEGYPLMKKKSVSYIKYWILLLSIDNSKMIHSPNHDN